jgi:hypothetical protein
MYRPVPGVERKMGAALLGVPRKANMKEHAVRGNKDLMEWRHRNPGIELHYMNKVVPPTQMPEQYSSYEYFVHLPIVKWSCERVVFEAALCGCKVVTNNNAEGVSWGLNLEDPEGLRAWIKGHQGDFWREVNSRVFAKKEGVHEVSRHGSDSICRVSPGPTALEQRA